MYTVSVDLSLFDSALVKLFDSGKLSFSPRATSSLRYRSHNICSFLLFSHSVMSNSLRPHGPWPVRLLCPRDSPGKNTGLGCHFLLQAQKRMPEETGRPRGYTADQRLMPPGQETLLWPETRAQSSQNLRQQHAWRVFFVPTPCNHKSSSLLLANQLSKPVMPASSTEPSRIADLCASL